MTPSSPISGKTALIAGGTSSIGAAVAARFAKEGARVILAGRSSEKLHAAFLQLTKVLPRPELAVSNPASHTTARLDVASLAHWKDVTRIHPRIDILVNCAGISQEKLLVLANEDEIGEILSVNLQGTILGCKLVGKAMMRRKSGVIINVSSLLAHCAVVGTSVYAAAKAGVVGLTNALSQEYGRFGVRVNAVVPGYIESPMTKDLKDRDELIKQIPLERFGTPEEVADAILFLARNQYANNCILNLDGGLSA
ncbi:hypothetical protein VTK26DRAFT_4573 [Humicola hyalothermophila]